MLPAAPSRWPRDVPRPGRAPLGERERRPAHDLPFETREGRLRSALLAAGELVRDAEGLLAGWIAFTIRWAALLQQERDQAREVAAQAETHAADAVQALLVSAERRLDLELQIDAARAALPALEAAIATGRRADVAAALAPLVQALRGRR